MHSPIFREGDGRLTARPEHYAMLAFSLAGRGALVQLTPEGGAAINLAAHATRNFRGQRWVTILNKDLGRDADVKISVPGRWQTAQRYGLRAPTAESTGQVTLAGAEVAADGQWNPRPQPRSPARDGGWQIAVPRASALLLQLQR